jgi:hypothetical protein
MPLTPLVQAGLQAVGVGGNRFGIATRFSSLMTASSKLDSMASMARWNCHTDGVVFCNSRSQS